MAGISPASESTKRAPGRLNHAQAELAELLIHGLSIAEPVTISATAMSAGIDREKAYKLVREWMEGHGWREGYHCWTKDAEARAS